MLSQFFTAHHNGQNSGSWRLSLPIIGVLVLMIALTPDITDAVTVSGFGTENNLPLVWVEVVARDLDYINPQGPWVSVSSHEYEIINYHIFKVQYTYEFRHWVVEVNDNGTDGQTVVDVPPRGRDSVRLPAFGNDFNGGVLTGECDGLMEDRHYRVKAYTRIHAWKEGQGRLTDNWIVQAKYDFMAR